jgi:hypothetical protein
VLPVPFTIKSLSAYERPVVVPCGCLRGTGHSDARLWTSLRQVLVALGLLVVLAVTGCGSAGAPRHSGQTPSAPRFDWIGNTFAGENFDQVPHAADDLSVAPDGVAATAANWVESGHELRAYDARGHVSGPRSGAHDNGRGLRSVSVTNSSIYATSGLSLLRYPRAQFMRTVGRSVAATPQRLIVRSSGRGYLMGVAACRGRIYVADPAGPIPDHERRSPDTTEIKVVKGDMSGGVIRAWRVPRARHLDCDRHGNLWVLQQRTGTQRARLVRYSPTGSLLGAFQVTGIPLDVAADPMHDQVLVADNGIDQRVERYDYRGRRVGALGLRRGYLAGPTRGLLGSHRFVGPRGVDVDAKGNVYVAQSGVPGYGNRAWADSGPLLIVSKFRPDGTEAWRDQGLHFVAVGEPSADDKRLYTTFLSYSRGADGRWHPRAFTADPWAHPSDPRLRLRYENTPHVRDLSGRRYVFLTGGDDVRVYRVKDELLVPSTVISPRGGTHEHIKIPHRARQSKPGRIPGDCAVRDIFVQGNGDVWRLCQDRGGVWRYRLAGFTGKRDPVYRFSSTDVYPLPPQIAVGGRVEVHGTAVYVSGWGPGEEDADDIENWRWSGKRIVKFGSLPRAAGWPAPVWNQVVHWGSGRDILQSRDKPVSWAVDGGVIAVGYQTNEDQAANRSPGESYLRILSAADGSELQVVQWPREFGLAGWLDMPRPVTFRNGRVYVEDDQLSKIMSVCASGRCRVR